MKGTHSPRQVAFNYLADHNDAHEASRACHASGKAGSAGNKKSARAADDDRARGAQGVIMIPVWYATFMLDFIYIMLLWYGRMAVRILDPLGRGG